MATAAGALDDDGFLTLREHTNPYETGTWRRSVAEAAPDYIDTPLRPARVDMTAPCAAGALMLPVLIPDITTPLPGLDLGWTALGFAVLADGSLAVLADDQQIAAHDFHGQANFDSEAYRERIRQAKAKLWTLKEGVWEQRFDFPLEAPSLNCDRLPDGRWVIVAARTLDQPNARLFSSEGRLLARFMLGDGIQHMQADALGRIWVGWFDEGVFGNSDWEIPGREWPPSASVIACFNDGGDVLWEMGPEPLDLAIDCYALNVTGPSAWASTYTDFPLHHLAPATGSQHWTTELDAPKAIAVAGDHVLVAGGYGPLTATLLRLDPAGSATLEQWTFNVPRSELALVQGRGSEIHVIAGHEWRRYDAGRVAEGFCSRR